MEETGTVSITKPLGSKRVPRLGFEPFQTKHSSVLCPVKDIASQCAAAVGDVARIRIAPLIWFFGGFVANTSKYRDSLVQYSAYQCLDLRGFAVID